MHANVGSMAAASLAERVCSAHIAQIHGHSFLTQVYPLVLPRPPPNSFLCTLKGGSSREDSLMEVWEGKFTHNELG